MFETVTAASPWEIPTAKRTQLIGGAFALHFAAATTYLILSVWTIRDVAPPKLFEAFVPEYAPPAEVTFVPMRVVEAQRTPAAGPASRTDPAPVPAQPTAVNELAPAPAIPIQESAGRGLNGWVDRGEGAVPTAGAAGGAGEAAIRYHSGMTKPEILFRSEPRYPEVARRLHKQGVVVIEAEIGRDGLVRSARAVSALGFGFEESAL
jgi:outer membrane biosynthesis protein TonB